MADYSHKLSTYSQKIVTWMKDHGHPSYQNEIDMLNDRRLEVISDAGRNWQYCEFTQEALAKIDEEIEETARCAVDRYEDWASD